MRVARADLSALPLSYRRIKRLTGLEPATLRWKDECMLFLLEHRLCLHISVEQAQCQETFDTKYGVTLKQQIYEQQRDAEPDSGPMCCAVVLKCGCSTSRHLPLFSLQTSLYFYSVTILRTEREFQTASRRWSSTHTRQGSAE